MKYDKSVKLAFFCTCPPLSGRCLHYNGPSSCLQMTFTFWKRQRHYDKFNLICPERNKKVYTQKTSLLSSHNPCKKWLILCCRIACAKVKIGKKGPKMLSLLIANYTAFFKNSQDSFHFLFIWWSHDFFCWNFFGHTSILWICCGSNSTQSRRVDFAW